MIKNYYYLVAGILAIIFSITHALNGQNTILPFLQVSTIDTETRTIFFYVWHIITAENLVFGIVFLFMSIQENMPKVKYAATIIAILLIVRWIVIFTGTLMYNASGLKNIIIDSIAIAIYVSLILLGTKVKIRQRVAH